MSPPVALLIYLPRRPKQAVFYPFAEFSPEWQAIQYGLARQAAGALHRSAAVASVCARCRRDGEKSRGVEHSAEIRRDPLRWIAEAAGYSDSERWWDHMIERRRDSTESFKAIMELMSALREEVAKTRRVVCGAA